MNSISFLYFFGIVFGAQARGEYELFADAEYYKNSINSITSDLANFERSSTLTYYVDLSTQKSRNYETIQHALTLVQGELRNATISYMARGKDVSLCYRSSEEYLDAKSKIAFRELDRCMDREKPLIDSILADIRNHVHNADSILEYLNSIVLSCSSDTPSQVATCLSDRIRAVKQAVNEYKSPVYDLKERAGALLYTGTENNYQCMGAVINSFRNELHEARIAHDKCMWNAQ